MDTQPICSYEGSDYQQSFWEKGGREYEDGVEAVALSRLLPSSGNLLLELGAGAGRNTLRYKYFNQIVLVDYSETQLAQARDRLGISEKYRYVLADIYNLPFVDGLFDCCTMIRTLHHMADARLAISQVSHVLQPGAAFILEFANKQNIKAILRYLISLQSWNPFSPEQVEFAPLNYNFHPGTVRTWLRLNKFLVDRQLTVSHFRIGFLKRILPTRLLIGIDALFQHTGDLWQLSPSVFLLSHRVGELHAAGDSHFFKCPSCGNNDLKDTPPEIICQNCNKAWVVRNNIYDFRI